MRENFHINRRWSSQSGELFILSQYGGGVGVSPRKFLKNGCNWCVLSQFFAEFVLFFFLQKIVCNFCLQSSDLRYTWYGRIFTLAEEDHIKPKRGVFYLLAVGGGGGRDPSRGPNFFCNKVYCIVLYCIAISFLSCKPWCAGYVMREFSPH